MSDTQKSDKAAYGGSPGMTCCASSISLRDALAYEIASSWWAPLVSWGWAQNLAGIYYARKASRKHGRITRRIKRLKIAKGFLHNAGSDAPGANEKP